MADTYNVLLKAITTRLKADGVITGLVNDRVYSNLPPQAQANYPYVHIEIDSAPFSAKDFTGMEHTVEIKSFDREASPKKAGDIRSAVYDSLNRSEDSLTLDSGHVVSVEFTGTSVTFKENDGVTWQTVIQFKIIVT